MPQVHRRSTGSSPDFRPARSDSGPATRGVGRRQLGGRRLGLGAVADSGVRGGDAKERTDRAQEEEAEAEEEWRKRESVVRGGHRGNGERNKGHAKLPVCPSLLPFIYSTVQT